MRIYVAGAISGGKVEDVKSYFTNMSKELSSYGFDVLSPMTGKGKLRTSDTYRAMDYPDPIATNRAIIGRDRWMVGQADVIFCNLSGATRVSIGSMMELAWAYELRKHIVLVMEKDNIHQHAFVKMVADIIFETSEEALEYLESLAKGTL